MASVSSDTPGDIKMDDIPLLNVNATPPALVVDSFPALVRNQFQKSCDFFVGNVGLKPTELRVCTSSRLAIKLLDEYNKATHLNTANGYASNSAKTNSKRPLFALTNTTSSNAPAATTDTSAITRDIAVPLNAPLSNLIDSVTGSQEATLPKAAKKTPNTASNGAQNESGSEVLLAYNKQFSDLQKLPGEKQSYTSTSELSTLTLHSRPTAPKPTWHAPWKLHRVISGHQGWVQCLAVDPSNEWFVSGGNDRLVKIWDLATGTLKLSLTGHINTVRDVAISARHPYLFSCGEDNRVKCWDLEQNKVVRDYHGHLSGVYCLTLHPGIDVLASGGRDAVVRLWDMRTKNAIFVLSGHSGTVMSLQSQTLDPQLISGSQDKTVRLWDIAAGKCSVVLTNHKKSIRAMAIHPREYTFCSAAADNIKVWRCPEGRFDRNIEGHNAIINCCSIKEEGAESSVLVTGTNNGQLNFWDWRSGYKFDTIQSRVQPGSLESENGIFACVFDKSESRLITGECDKTIKVWKEDVTATPESNPIQWKVSKSIKHY